MTILPFKEAFIPYSRHEIIELCLADGKVIAIAEQQEFREFCQILAAYYHFKLHSCLEDLKFNFVPFNPDLNSIELKLYRIARAIELRAKGR